MCRPDRLTTGSSRCISGNSGVSTSSLSSMGGMMKSSFGKSTASFFRAFSVQLRTGSSKTKPLIIFICVTSSDWNVNQCLSCDNFYDSMLYYSVKS